MASRVHVHHRRDIHPRGAAPISAPMFTRLTDAWFLFENLFPGGILVNKLDVWGGFIAGIVLWGLARSAHLDWSRTQSGLRRLPMLCSWLGFQSAGSGSWSGLPPVWLRDGVGYQAGRTVLHHLSRAEGLAGSHHRGLDLHSGSHRRRAHCGRGRRTSREVLGSHIGGGIEYWFAYVLAVVRPRGLFGERIIERI